jgi:hypothetical protein
VIFFTNFSSNCIDAPKAVNVGGPRDAARAAVRQQRDGCPVAPCPEGHWRFGLVSVMYNVFSAPPWAAGTKNESGVST